MDDRRFYDPRHRPPPPSSTSSSIGNRREGGGSPSTGHFRDHPAYRQSSESHRAWEDDQQLHHAPPPLPMLSSGQAGRETSNNGHHLNSFPSHPPRAPPPHHYDYDHRRVMYEEDRGRDYEGARHTNHSFRDDFDDVEQRYQEGRNWSSSRPSVQPSYQREYYSPETDRDRGRDRERERERYHAAMSMDDREPAPSKPAMSISSLLDSGTAPVSTSNQSDVSRHSGQDPRYISPPHQEAYDRRTYHAQPPSVSRSRMYSESLSPQIEQHRGGASISNLLDDGDERHSFRDQPRTKDVLAAPDARFSLSHLSSPEPKHASGREKAEEGGAKSMMSDVISNEESLHYDETMNGSVESIVVPKASGRKSGGKLKLRREPLPKAKKKVEEEWDSDLSADENKPLWASEINAYGEEIFARLQCIEQAFDGSLAERERVVGKRLSHAYRLRYEPVMARVKTREEHERKQKEARQKQRKEANRKQREREVEMELLDTLDDASVNRSKVKIKAKLGRSIKPSMEELEEDARLKKRKAGDSSSLEMLLLEGDDSVMDSRASSPDSLLDDDTPLAMSAGLTSAMTQEKREQQIIDAHRRIWTGIARKDIPKVYRTVQASATNKAMYWRRVSSVVAREAKRGIARSNKSTKDVQVRARKVMREMLVFWKRNEKEERELRKKAEKEALDKAKKEEEMREAKRQARKLNFLITQTELYSHFVGNKLKTNEAEESEETSGSGKLIEIAPSSDADPVVAPVNGERANVTEAEAKLAELKDLDFDDDDEANLRAHARRNAEEAVAAAKAKAVAFDTRAAEERLKLEEQQRLEGEGGGDGGGGRRIEEKDLGKAFDQDDLNFLNPTSMGAMDVAQPKMLTCQLKEYQLKGLNWLANLYEQGINGILADEMGLGKTVQSIALMAYLAEVHDIWGPFLVIAPASTLHNWQQEIARFVPSLKALPYWGNVKDRTVLRKFWNRKQVSYHRDAPFHVLITSYQLVVSDEKYFQRVKWQYMVLDEAQAIKSSSSNRWKTLLGFDCRNRLLLTGTPVQNSMQELWALLHFIMPSLFDSHDEFSEWFSKDIESHAENKGTLNEHQLRRLHMILKPFMLRRIKKNVQNELGDKIEIDLFCDMSARQRALYKSLRSRVSITDLMDKAQNLNDEAGLKSLMNLVMQFRKVCNHPELFERADVEAPLAFANFAKSGSLARESDFLSCYDSTASLIEYSIPKLLCREGIMSTPGLHSRSGFDTNYLGNLSNIWRAHNIHTSLKDPRSGFGFASLLRLNATDLEEAMHSDGSSRVMKAVSDEAKKRSHGKFLYDVDFAISRSKAMGDVCTPLPSNSGVSPSFVTPLDGIAEAYRSDSFLAKRTARSLITPVVAPPIRMIASDGPFTRSQEAKSRDQAASQMLFGVAPSERESEAALQEIQTRLPDVPPNGLLYQSPDDQMPMNEMQVPQMNKLIIDSSKLSKLDELLRTLKAEGHRVLIYFQMTKMIDLMEEYLIYKQYKYLRLDGSSKISDRRDMVTDWQTKPELFIFLLSTRAGGLGINLTAADTVIFYDHDWNPSNDSQAMDRAHRLGQTKQVTVYRLITKNTIDERIVKLARNKKEVQDIVVGTKAYSETGMAKPNEIVSLLLDDEQLAESMLRKKQDEERNLLEEKAASARNSQAKRKAARAEAALAVHSPRPSTAAADWTLDDDEDDFFGAKPAQAPIIPEPLKKAELKTEAGGRKVSRLAPKKGKKEVNRPAEGPEGETGASQKKKPRLSKSQRQKEEAAAAAATAAQEDVPMNGGIDAMIDEDESML
ncbi:hypothetical protein CBS101457_002672 [Exobasidium rhododendri]|nr:hypothetical protein CBS101457_002672 [Exobasidium rhododendri]